MLVRSTPLFAIALLASSATAFAQPSPPIKVAVVSTNVVNLTEREASTMTLAIASAIRRELKVIAQADVATQANARQAAPNIGHCVVQPACVSKLRDALGVDAVLFVALARVASITRVDIRYVAPGSDQSVQVLDDQIEQPTIDGFAEHARELVPDAEPRGRPQPVATSNTVVTRPASPGPVEREPSRLTARVILSGSLTLATAGVATYMGTRALNCQDVSDRCTDQQADDANRDALITDILIGASLVGAVVTGYLLWRGDEQPRSNVTLVPSARGGSVVWGTNF